MRKGSVLVTFALAVAPGCQNRKELQQLEADLSAHVTRQEHAVQAMSSHRASALKSELLAALDGGLTHSDAGAAVRGEPAMLVSVPETSFFETGTDAKLRAKISLLQAESEQLDRVMNELAEMDARKQRSDAQLKLLESLQPDGGGR